MSDNMENRSDLEQEDTLESPETIQETTNAPVAETKTESEEYSLNDDRRVKVLSRHSGGQALFPQPHRRYRPCDPGLHGSSSPSWRTGLAL